MVAVTELEDTSEEPRGDDNTRLTTLLQSLSSSSPPSLGDEHLQLVARALSPLNRDFSSERLRALAFLVLSRLVTNQQDVARSATVISAYILAQLRETSIPRLLKGISLLDALLQVDSAAKDGESGGGGLSKRVIEADGMIESLVDVLDVQLFTAEEDEDATTHDADEDKQRPGVEAQHALLDYSIAQLFSSVANIAAYRAILDGRPQAWLEQQLAKPLTSSSSVPSATEAQTQVMAAVALTKLAKAAMIDPALKGKTGSERDGEKAQEETTARAADALDHLTTLLQGVVISASNVESPTASNPSGNSAGAITSALEGLAYTSSQPALKEALGMDEHFLKSLVDIAKSLSLPQRQRTNSSKLSASYGIDLASGQSGAPSNHAATYGIATIMLNLFARRTVLTEEQRQVEALKKMANAGATGGKNKTMGQAVKASNDAEDEAMSDTAVHARVRRGIKNGVVEAVSALAKVDSSRTKQVLGNVLLALVHEREDRLEIIKRGGYKTLKSLIGSLLGNESASSNLALDKDSLPTLQALAKLVITTAPPQLFGTDSRAGALDTVRPVALLLLHPGNNMLQRFEAMMALTNLASVDPSVAQRIYTFKAAKPVSGSLSTSKRPEDDQVNDQIIQAVENQMLEDHRLVRRAAVELVCNLLISDESFARYSGDYIADSNPSITSPEQARKASTPRIHILLALTDVRDLPTRLAASGALAMLTQSATACSILLGLGGDSKKVWEKVGGLLAPLKADRNAGGDEDFEEEEEGDIEELSTLPPDEGLVHRGLTIILNLFGDIGKLSPTENAAKFQEADDSGLTRHLLNLLAIWTDKNLLMAKKVKPPPKEVLDMGIECLRILKTNGVELVA